MTGMFAKGGLREVTIEATVLGPCETCGKGAEFCECPDFHPCFIRPYGVVSRWHKNPLVRLWWRASDSLRRR